MVLNRDMRLACFSVDYRMIGASVSVFQFECLTASCHCDQLMPHTNTKYRHSPAYDFTGDIYAIDDPVRAVSNYIIAKELDPANTKRYDAKIKLMSSEKGRQAVITKRLERI